MSKVAIKTPFCTICKNSGKSEGQYTSHNVKNKTGSVVCPTILQNICSICNKKGHFRSKCPDKNKMVSIMPVITKSHKQPSVEPKKSETKVLNAFSALCDDSDDDSDSEDNNQVICLDICNNAPISTVETSEIVVEEVPTQRITPVKRPIMKWHLIESSDEEDSDEE